jgi:hypothetical protein
LLGAVPWAGRGLRVLRCCGVHCGTTEVVPPEGWRSARILLPWLRGGSFGSRKTAGDICHRHKISSCGVGDTLHCLQDSSFCQKYTLLPYSNSSRIADDTCVHLKTSSRRGDDTCIWWHNSRFDAGDTCRERSGSSFGVVDTCCRQSGTNFCAGATFFSTTSRKPGHPRPLAWAQGLGQWILGTRNTSGARSQQFLR